MEKTVEQILRILSGGDAAIESKIELAEIEQMVKNAAADLALEEWMMNRKNDYQQAPNSSWLAEFEYTLGPSPIVNEKIALLPDAYIRLPKDRGLFSVFYVSDGQRINVTYMPPAVYVQPRSDAQKATNNYFYTLRADKMIVFNSCEDKSVAINKVIAIMSVPNSLTIDESRALWIIKTVVPILRQQMLTRSDMVTDNNPTA